MKKNCTKQKGFTLVETLVAVAILTLSITATFTAVQNGIRSSTFAKDQTVAFYLAQEGMEYVKNIRDENALNSLGTTQVSWLHGLADSGDPCDINTGSLCEVDSPNKTVSVSQSRYLKQDSTAGYFNYQTGADTAFKRVLQFTKSSNNNDEVIATITITWNDRGLTRTFQASETFFNRE